MEFKEKFKNIKEEILQYVENNVKKQNEWV